MPDGTGEFRLRAQRPIGAQPAAGRPTIEAATPLGHFRARSTEVEVAPDSSHDSWEWVEDGFFLQQFCTIGGLGRIEPDPSIYPNGSLWEVTVTSFARTEGSDTDNYQFIMVLDLNEPGVIIDSTSSPRFPWHNIGGEGVQSEGSFGTLADVLPDGAILPSFVNENADPAFVTLQIDAHSIDNSSGFEPRFQFDSNAGTGGPAFDLGTTNTPEDGTGLMWALRPAGTTLTPVAGWVLVQEWAIADGGGDLTLALWKIPTDAGSFDINFTVAPTGTEWAVGTMYVPYDVTVASATSLDGGPDPTTAQSTGPGVGALITLGESALFGLGNIVPTVHSLYVPIFTPTNGDMIIFTYEEVEPFTLAGTGDSNLKLVVFLEAVVEAD